jgi:hypothetical protein
MLGKNTLMQVHCSFWDSRRPLKPLSCDEILVGAAPACILICRGSSDHSGHCSKNALPHQKNSRFKIGTPFFIISTKTAAGVALATDSLTLSGN